MNKKLKNKKIDIAIQFIFFLLIFLLPTQLGKHWWPQWSLVNGIRIDYLAPTLYVTDVLLVGIAIIWGIREIRGIRVIWKKLGILGIWGIWALLRAERPMLCLYWMARYLEIAVMAMMVSRGIQGIKGFKGRETIQKALAIGVIFLVGLEMAQIVLGGSSGLFWILGERSFNISTPGISTISIWGREILRPYATFSHPNALAGYLAVAILLLQFSIFNFQFSKKKVIDLWNRLAIGLGVFGVILTASRAAIVAVITAGILGNLGSLGNLGIFKGAEKASGLILFAPEAKEERMILAKAAWKMFLDHPILGVGPGHFLVELPKYLPNGYWKIQPVHNIPFLILAEFGIAGGGIGVIWGIRKFGGIGGFGKIWIIIIITALVDHYWVTAQQNRLLLGMVMGLLINQYTNDK